jgi:tagatose-1,6-bisphosphate aldolase non-catalytic subunit AgaZ/GatZ
MRKIRNKIDLEKKQKILTDRDFINAPEYNNSLAELMKANDGKKIPELAMSRYLLMSRDEIDLVFQGALNKIRRELMKGE